MLFDEMIHFDMSGSNIDIFVKILTKIHTRNTMYFSVANFTA